MQREIGVNIKKIIFLSSLMLFLSTGLFAQTEVLWGGIYVYSSSNEELANDNKILSKQFVDALFDEMAKEDLSITLRVGGKRIADKNDMFELNGYAGKKYDYGIYGFVKVDSLFYDVEIRVFDFSLKEDVKVFYFKEKKIDSNILAEDLAGKLAKLFKRTNEYNGGVSTIWRDDYLNISWGAGYWLLADNDGLDNIYDITANTLPIISVSGKVDYAFGLKYRRMKKFFIYPSVGAELEYLVSMHKDSDLYFPHSMHEFVLKVPVLCNLEIPEVMVIYVGMAPGLEFGYFYQDRESYIYEDTNVGFLLSFSEGVNFFLGPKDLENPARRWTLGFEFEEEFIFYEKSVVPRFRLNVNLCVPIQLTNRTSIVEQPLSTTRSESKRNSKAKFDKNLKPKDIPEVKAPEKTADVSEEELPFEESP